MGPVPVENTVRALRRLAPGASLRTPRDADLRVLARALRSVEPGTLARHCPPEVARVVLADQVRALDRASTGFFGAGPPEAARLVRASRLRVQPGLRSAALAWAEAVGHGVLSDFLRGVPPAVSSEDGRRAAELTVAALLPRADCLPGEVGSPRGGAILRIRGVRVGPSGFRVDVDADPPMELTAGPTLRALWWNGLGRVTDDLGYEYLILAKDPAGTGTVRHWCHPRPARGARELRLESAGYRGERLRLSATAVGTSAEVLVKTQLTVRLET
ncbi:hypothetical protein VA596_01050 [Amycolatopsis sp., V23-08]|uniref:Uncharacterized protein n=1 Tax=Amycolatopsis heterodermiae TaxID=3110235 RepID=A0ABU5QW16_9PSEU|nr:hypothetical protein [Amycolatopsis sp., V23-08]MEA5358107.1 hypothetical protein [Amycolatopsis sp., V23-08]